MAARRGLLALLSSTTKDYEEVLAYVRSQRMSSKSLRRIVDELGIKHEDDLDEELSVPDLCELLTGHGKRGQSDHPAELSTPRDTNGQNSESEPEGENPGTLTCMPPRDEKMITSLLSKITRLVSITNDLKTELHGLKTKSQVDNEMALSKDREQRLTNRLSVLEKMLSNHGEMVQKNNDGIKSIESSLAASKEAVSRTDGKAMREERPRNTVSSLTTTTQQKTWADACKEETSDSESTLLSEAHGSKIKKRKRKLMPSHSTSKGYPAQRQQRETGALEHWRSQSFTHGRWRTASTRTRNPSALKVQPSKSGSRKLATMNHSGS